MLLAQGMGQTTMGPVPPSGFQAQPFNCPEGSDFDKSQEVGMCVGADYSPVPVRMSEGGPIAYIDLQGNVVGSSPRRDGEPAPVSYWVLVVGGGVLLMLLMLGRRR